MARGYNDYGIIIKTLPYKDADKIITLLTCHHGLVTCFAKGARRSTSKKSPHLDLLNLVSFQMNGDSTLFLQEAVSQKTFLKLKSDIKKTSLAMSFLEILNQLLAESVEDQPLYTSFVNFLEKLNHSQTEEQNHKLSTQFGTYLLRHLGYPLEPVERTGSLSKYFEHLMNRKIIGKEIV